MAYYYYYAKFIRRLGRFLFARTKSDWKRVQNRVRKQNTVNNLSERTLEWHTSYNLLLFYV